MQKHAPVEDRLAARPPDLLEQLRYRLGQHDVRAEVRHVPGHGTQTGGGRVHRDDLRGPNPPARRDRLAFSNARRRCPLYRSTPASSTALRRARFRFVIFPAISTALVSGALLAFALSFDEVIVTTFTAGAQNTLPIWIFGNIRIGQQLPEVNVIVFVILLVTIIPVTIAQRLTRESGILRNE
jgi:hypothetical protein